MKIIFTPFIILFFFIASVQAQMTLNERKVNAPKEKFSDHLFFGGTFGLQFGTQTYIELAPIVGYKLTQRLTAGIGIKYIYYKFNDSYYNNTSNIYGGGPFARFTVFDGLFLHAEYEILNIEVAEPPYYNNYKRENINSVFLGGGYRQMIGDRSSLDFLFLYNINESTNSPYVNPVIRIGFGFGI